MKMRRGLTLLRLSAVTAAPLSAAAAHKPDTLLLTGDDSRCSAVFHRQFYNPKEKNR